MEKTPTKEEYEKAQDVIFDYEAEQKRAWDENLKSPCPSCGNKRSTFGYCHDCGITTLNWNDVVKDCDEFHTHHNVCYVPYSTLFDSY